MTEWIWINGDVMPLAEASVGVEDRGFQFADGVYEVIRIYNGRPFTLREHLERLERSAGGIEMALPQAAGTIAPEVLRLIGKSCVSDGIVYLQATRGCCARNHVWDVRTPGTLLFYVRSLPPAPDPGAGAGVTLHPVADERWKRCWIKSIALLPNVLAKNAAVRAGADEAVFIEDGRVSECSASNLFAVTGGKLITAPVGPKVLPGITRLVLLEIAQELGIAVEEKHLRDQEAIAADELFITSTTRELSWVARWGDRPVGQGKCGPVTLKLHRAYQQRVAAEAGAAVRV